MQAAKLNLAHQPNPVRHRSLAWLLCAVVAAIAFATSTAKAAPEAHILRVDPRAAQENGAPILTTVIELVQTKRISDATAGCVDDRGTGYYRCLSDALEKPLALYQPFGAAGAGFPHENAIFTVKVEGTDQPASYVSHTKWGASLTQPSVGTAWLILIDADARIKDAFGDAKQIANTFIGSMSGNDIVNVMFFNDRQVVKDSKWMSAAKKGQAQQFVNGVTGTWASQGRNRSLGTIIKEAATDGWKSLGNVGEDVKVPLHQAMVVLSTGYGGTDALTTGPGGLQIAKYMSGGRFPEDNTALPKAPVPVISVFFPPKVYDEFRQNSLEFMRGLANTEIGGFFTVVQSGEGGRGNAIVGAVRGRFANMHIVKWRVSCIESGVTQTFGLVFKEVTPPILGDNTFKDVPVGIDPTTWPLDVNVQYTQDMAKRQGGVYPSGTFKVFGNFCWGGEKGRAEVYFLPAGQQAPAALSGADVDKAKRTQQQLIAMGMKGRALEVSDTYGEFEAPDKEKILHGSGEQAVVRLVIYDNKARRTSGVTADNIVQLKGTTTPFPVLWVLGGLFGVVVILLLIVVIVRSGGKKRGAQPPPAPVVAGGMPYGGGYGAPPQPYGAAPAPSPYGAAPAPSPYGAPAPMPAPAPPSPDFMYGNQPAPAPAPMPVGAPPPNPYGGAPAVVSRATLQGAAGVFTVVPGVEMRAGRDGSQCGILLSEPRVSGVHATLRLDGGQLVIRDENSNNGTQINGTRLTGGVWTPAPNGSLVRFGPVEFTVRLE
ncbi:MAG: FHA domain-containing protein [Myxococcales bacterium]|nr:FHA domain-containing protein [Myxococcales bacterium]